MKQAVRFNTKDLSRKAAWEILEANERKRGGTGYFIDFEGDSASHIQLFGFDEAEDLDPFVAELERRNVSYELIEEKDLPDKYKNGFAYETYLKVRQHLGD